MAAELSSGTPQMKSVMSLIGLDYPQVKAIQVSVRKKDQTIKVIRKKHRDWWKCWIVMMIMILLPPIAARRRNFLCSKTQCEMANYISGGKL